MPVYNPPQFNLACKIWHQPALYHVDPPDVTTVCQLYATRVIGTEFTFGLPKQWFVAQQIRFPAGTDVRFDLSGDALGDIVECPAGSGVYYEVHQVADYHKGFPNEYRVAYVLMHDIPAWPLP